MNMIEELIQKECPEGVEYLPLGEVLGVNRGKRLTKSQLSDDAPYTVYHGSKDVPLGNYLSSNVCGDTVIVVNTGGIGGVRYCEKDFWCSDGSFWIGKNPAFNNKFVYYYVVRFEEYFKSQKRSGGVPTIDKETVGNLEIPVPPLSVQHKIVEILDKFTSLEAELQAELEARKKQYEYYRNQLLDFTGREDVEFRKIGDITNVFSASRVHKHEWKTEGVPFWRSSDLISYFNGVENSRGKVFISPELYEKLSAKSGKIQKDDILVTGGGTIGIPYIVPNNLPMYVKDADLLCIVHNDLFCSKFLYHYMLSSKFRKYLSDITHDATIAHYTITQIKDTPFPIPPLTEQQRIVTILDKFEALINDQTASLAAEMKARHQQYEYYRDKLLSFKRKD